MTTQLDAIGRILGPHKDDRAALVATARALAGGETMGNDLLFALVALGLLALYTSVSNGEAADGTITPPSNGPVVTPPSGGSGTSGSTDHSNPPPITTSGDGDMIDPATVQIVNAPDFRSWPIVTRIVGVDLEPTNAKIYADVSQWPGTFPEGFGDPISFTVWAFLSINGQWVCSGFIEGVDGYHGADGVGDGVFDFVNNWWYSERWSPMTGHVIHDGEPIGFMLTGGDARDDKGPYTNIRTQIVVVNARERASYRF